MEQLKKGTNISSVILKVLSVFSILIFAYTFVQKISARHTVKCSYFSTQSEAQSMFDSDRVKYDYLDRNHDGIACNGLFKQ